MTDKPWHHRDAAALQDLKTRIAASFPDLHVIERGEAVLIIGWFSLTDNGVVVDRYQIEVQLPEAYPQGLPVLREIEGRIPRSADRHMQEDGHGCLLVPDEFWYKHPKGMDVLDFLNGPVLGYLAGQSLVERGESWPFGERPHGDDGILEFYTEILGTVDRATIIRHLEVLAAKTLRGHWPCPCGNGNRIRSCHRQLLDELRDRIPASVARSSLDRLTGSHDQP